VVSNFFSGMAQWEIRRGPLWITLSNQHVSKTPRIKKESEVIIVQLTKKDRELLTWIGQMGYVSCEQVMKKTGVARSAAYWRLHRLVKSKYLRHISYSRYEAGIYAANIFTESRGILLPPQRKISPFNVKHNLTVVDVSLALSLQGEWISEREFSAMKRLEGNTEFHSPDGILVLSNKKIAIEVELMQKSGKRLRKVLQKHNRSRDYDEVWYLVPNKRMQDKFLDISREYPLVKVFLLEKVLLGNEKSQKN